MSVWQTMTNEQRVAAVHFDIMRHNEMALLAGIVTMGRVLFMPVGTACTDGLDCIYDPDFWRALDRLEARFVVGHENFHKALKHCTAYKPLVKKYPTLSNYAQDYVINGLLHRADPNWTWMKPPHQIKILLDAKYYGMSFPQVLRELLKQGYEEPEPPNGGDVHGDFPVPSDEDGKEGGKQGRGGKQQGKGKGKGGKLPDGEVLDEHREGNHGDGQEKIDTEIDNSLRQGEILCKANRHRSNSGSGGAFNVTDVVDSKTDWVSVTQDFVQSTIKGADIARWTRVNTRIFGATGGRVLLPTLYDERVGHVGLFVDTSGSMVTYYPNVFGEVAHSMETIKPEKVTVIWWDTRVAHVQEFNPDEYANIRTLMRPAGGGGTSPQCVADYVHAKRLSFQCAIWLTDGYIGEEPTGLSIPQLWGVIENESFNARTGKTVHIRCD